ncbi:MAG: lipocalin-like domain-containing protein, partial [Candidatus Methylomirabilales bacterium]
MRIFRLGLLFFFVLASTASGDQWQVARPDYRWSFPQDHWARNGYRTEWWYFTGHLTTEEVPPRRFGYQFTFFRVGLMSNHPDLQSEWATNNLIMGHAAISDLAGGKHLFSEVLYRAMPLLGGFGRYPEPLIAWSRGPAGTDGQWTLRWNGRAFDFSMRDEKQQMAFQLSTQPAKRVVFQGPNGFSRKGEGPTAASQYYSFTRLLTEGTLSIEGKTVRVQGESWMDKEFGSNQLEANQVGWDWFSLQLRDGREIMLYLLRDERGAIDFAQGTLVSREGVSRYLNPKEWSVQAMGTWRSPETGAEYPSRWIVELPRENLRMAIVPEMA